MMPPGEAVRWRKSSYSNPDGGECVEVAGGVSGVVPVRDSKLSHGPVLMFPPGGWAAFVSAVRGAVDQEW
ncbi:DUF397 domain-containing protein [Streptomyces cacaoi]|uniref:DUF397 domain-containing protein n=1 Tax=Streptomyces cacaoi TaxID=1898 RepID=UPI002629BB38|nr:DUF397 domain-containing protein [Streptomyces cacaoi]